MTSAIERTARYQDDLARLLTALEPAERAEVLDSVREHIDAALAEVEAAPTEEDVNRILAELGSPGAVAEAALAERPAARPYSGAATTVIGVTELLRERLQGRWVPPVALLAVMIGGGLLTRVVSILLLAVGIVMIAMSPLWMGKEKVWGAIMLPLCSFMILGSFWMLLSWRASIGSLGIHTIGFYLFAAASLTILTVLWTRGAKRARAHIRASATGGAA